MNLDIWAKRHGVSPQALQELRLLYGVGSTVPPMLPGESEAAVQNRIRLEASDKGLRIWRNNVGVLMDDRGIPVRMLRPPTTEVQESKSRKEEEKN